MIDVLDIDKAHEECDKTGLAFSPSDDSVETLRGKLREAEGELFGTEFSCGLEAPN